jgi:hypothetical protein
LKKNNIGLLKKYRTKKVNNFEEKTNDINLKSEKILSELDNLNLNITFQDRNSIDETLKMRISEIIENKKEELIQKILSNQHNQLDQENNFQLNKPPSFKIKSESLDEIERLSSIQLSLDKLNSDFFSFDLGCNCYFIILFLTNINLLFSLQ